MKQITLYESATKKYERNTKPLFTFFKKIFESTKTERYVCISCYLLTIILCITFALNKIYYSDFYPIDGDFQNYNGYNRLLSGQIPFKDFFFYLGLGPLYMKSLLLFFVGNNFTNSIFITNFISSLLFTFALYTIFRCNSLNNIKSIFLALIGLVYSIFIKDLSHGYIATGNSDRMVRSFLPFLIVILLYLKSRIKINFKNEYKKNIVYGIFLGCCIPWSNDYGTSVFISGCYLYLLKNFKFSKTFALKFLTFFLGCILGCFGLVNLLTLGNFLNWFNYNFIGVASYQFWYYERLPEMKFLTLSDLPLNSITISSICIIVLFSIRIIKQKESKNELYLCFLFLATTIAGFLYAVNSMKYGLFVPLNILFRVTVFLYLIKKIIPIFNKCIPLGQKQFMVLSIILVFFMVIPSSMRTINRSYLKRGVYIHQLNGYLSEYGNELKLISNKLNKGEKLFSTYASALEIMTNQFQPSGIDYIIHAMGDKYREKYLQSFKKICPKYASTIREDFTEWEFWIKRANWFFYRELFNYYQPIAVTPYNIIWRRANKSKMINVKGYCSIIKQTDNSMMIAVKTKKILNNDIAELKISYKTIWNKQRINGMGIRKLLFVQDSWSHEDNKKRLGYFIPEVKDNLYIPVKIDNGEGKVLLTSYPEKLTELEIINCKVNQVLPDVEAYLNNTKVPIMKSKLHFLSWY